MSAWLSSSSSSDAKLFGSHGFKYQMTAGEDYGVHRRAFEANGLSRAQHAFEKNFTQE